MTNNYTYIVYIYAWTNLNKSFLSHEGEIREADPHMLPHCARICAVRGILQRNTRHSIMHLEAFYREYSEKMERQMKSTQQLPFGTRSRVPIWNMVELGPSLICCKSALNLVWRQRTQPWQECPTITPWIFRGYRSITRKVVFEILGWCISKQRLLLR